jgi:endonuclease/exonuclease/phosphatase family metal-dependent hydrolase
MLTKRLRIGTWNIGSNRHHDEIVARIAELDLDICATQEVWLDCATDLLAIIRCASSSGYCWYFTPALTPNELNRNKSEYYGLAILSRAPFQWTASFPLGPGNREQELSSEREPRVMQVAAARWERLIVVANTHLADTPDWTPSSIRRSQVSRLTDILRPIAGPGPLLLCGDFNTGPASDDLAELRKVLPYGYATTRGTYVAEPERPPIDFFCSSTELAVEVSVFSARGLSDHDVAVATLESDEGTSTFFS